MRGPLPLPLYLQQGMSVSYLIDQFIIDEKAKAEAFTRVHPPEDLDLICNDLKVCGRRELFNLLKFRHKYQRLVDQDRKKSKAESEKLEKELNKKDEPTENDLEDQNDKELEETIKRVEKERKRQEKKERERKVKSELRAKMSVIASTDIYNQNDDVLFDKRTLEKLRKVDIEELQYDHQSSDSDNEAGGMLKGIERPKTAENEG